MTSKKDKRKQRQADAKKEKKSNASSSKTNNGQKEDSFTSETLNDESVQAEGGENTSLSEVKVENSPPAVVPKKTDNQVTIFFL